MLNIDEFNLPDISPQQQDFVMAIPLCKDNFSAAYRYAYNCENMSAKTINEEASRLAKNPKVAPWIEFYRNRAKEIIKKEFDYSVVDAMKEYTELQEMSLKNYKTYNVARGCIDGKCRIAGLDKTNTASANVVVKMENVQVDGKNLQFNIGKEVNDDTTAENP